MAVAVVSPVVTSAANDTVVTVELSEKDTNSGVVAIASTRNLRFDSTDTTAYPNGLTVADVLASYGVVLSGSSWDTNTNFVNNQNELTISDVYYELRTTDGGLWAYGWLSDYDSSSTSQESGGDYEVEAGSYTLYIETFVDEYSAGHYESENYGGDGIDDREQVGYSIYVQTEVGSSYYTTPVPVFWAEADDDMVAMVSNYDYVLDGYDEVYLYNDEVYYLYFEVDYDNAEITAYYVATEDGSKITAVNENTSSSTETEEGETEGSTESDTETDVETGDVVTVPDTSSK